MMRLDVSAKVESKITKTAELELLPIEAVERDKALLGVLTRPVDFDLIDSVERRIEERAAIVPDRIALTDDQHSFTYSQLVAAVSQIAFALQHHVTGTSPVIAVSGKRSAASVLAFLAIEKIGGIYLPVDQMWPELRIQEILTDSGAACVVVDGSEVAEGLSAAASTLERSIVNVSGLLANSVRCDLPAYRAPSADTPRYILYTSGSTGRPKGAVVEHQGMINHLLAKVLDLQLTEADCLAQTASLSFDISIWQMLATLMVGGRVTVIADDDVLSPQRLIDAVQAKSITILEVVPTILSLLLDEQERKGTTALSRLRYLLATGEALPPTTARRWITALPAVPLVNAYGPTECSDDVTHEFVSMPPSNQINTPIGHPIANAFLYILAENDGSYRACELEEPGELFVGGICVGRGYFGDPVRTRAAFFRDPFGVREGGRLYRTGDLVKRTPSGALEYLGRIDRQVKISGVRIELGEIEEVLRQYEGVTAAFVVAPWKAENSGGAHNRSRLIAYVTGESMDSEATRMYLMDRLPRSMVPSEIVWLTEIPLTPNGKVDFKKLEDLARHKDEGRRETSTAAVFAHTALLHGMTQMRSEGLEAGMQAIQTGTPADVALQSVLGLALGITQILPTSSSSDIRDVYDHCSAHDASILNVSGPVSGVLSPDEAALMRSKLTHVRIERSDLQKNEHLIEALSGYPDSPEITVRYDADAAIAVSSYKIPRA